jgi:hypothetical protein
MYGKDSTAFDIPMLCTQVEASAWLMKWSGTSTGERRGGVYLARFLGRTDAISRESKIVSKYQPAMRQA